MDNNRPKGREKRVTGPAATVHKRGEGLGTGPVGEADGYKDRKQSGGSGSARASGGRPTSLIGLLLVLLLGGGGGLAALLGGGPGGGQAALPGNQAGQIPSMNQPSASLVQMLGSLGGGNVSTGWQSQANTGKLNTSVAPGAREKYTKLLGNGRDTATIMVYMCGTDLESRNSMGTYDLQEMLAAQFGKNVSLLVYTGGCKGWKNNAVSSSVNQIWQIQDGQMYCLEKDLGSAAMTDPDTLSSFIRWCAERCPASRYELILWDHGGGSVSGYGYDEKFASGGSMTLEGLDRALRDGGLKFDFIGFDACLMATAETALTMSQYADYLIASEETEPGVGWYYTGWLTDLGKDTSMPTLQLGQKIVDSFVDTCAQKCRGQSTTLSVVDLAELETTLPQALADFSRSTAGLIQSKQYQTVSKARGGCREFARSSQIDQVDLTHLAQNLGTKEGDALSKVLLSAVKYNRTSSDMTNAYGLSIYFPYRKTSSVDKAVKTYDRIGMDKSYSRCIRQFASLAASGQAASGGTASPLPTLLGSLGGSSAGGDMVSALLGEFLSGGFGRVAGLTGDNTDFLSDRAMSDADTVQFLTDNRFPDEALVWQTGEDGNPVMYLTEEQWGLVQELELNLFYDDGEGYIDLGLDNSAPVNEYGGLMGSNDGAWVSIDNQPVAYYHMSTFHDGEHYTITGRVPVLHNGVRAELILVFDNDNTQGYVAGVQTVYLGGETDTVAKSQAELQPGDTLDFLCDYYSYDGDYQDSYMLGEPLTVTEQGLTVGAVPLDGVTQASYRFTDIFGQHHWTPTLTSS